MGLFYIGRNVILMHEIVLEHKCRSIDFHDMTAIDQLRVYCRAPLWSTW